VGMIASVYLLVSRLGVELLANGLERFVVQPLLAAIASAVGPGLVQEILVGQYGLLSLGLFNALCTVLPILSVFYLLFGLLEEIGYFPLLSVQFDRLLHSVGLTGKAVLPMTLGFGCNSVATMTTRNLESPRQRFIACFLISLGIPCAVQLGVMVAILSTTPLYLLLLLACSVVAIQIVVGNLLSRVLPKQARGEFIMELPPLRRPRLRVILYRTYHRLVEFLLEACPMFVASAAILLVLHFSGLLVRLHDLLSPLIVSSLGMPRDFAEMLIMTLARREVGAVMFKVAVDRGQFNLQQIFVGLLVMTLFVPCLSNVLIMSRVLGWLKTTVITTAVIFISLGAGAIAHLLWA
jgi:ferrous iron transport protein B